MKKLDPQHSNSNRQGQQTTMDEDTEGLPVIRPLVAGIDLGSEQHWVCAPRRDGAGCEATVFGATTPELEKMALWLKERKSSQSPWRYGRLLDRAA